MTEVINGYGQKRAIEMQPDYATRLTAIYLMVKAGNVPTPEAFIESIQYANALETGLIEPEEVKNVQVTDLHSVQS